MLQLLISESSLRTLKHKRLNPRLYKDTFHITDPQSQHNCDRVALLELRSSITTREVDWIHKRGKIFSFLFVRVTYCFLFRLLKRILPRYSDLLIFTLSSHFIIYTLLDDNKVASEPVKIQICTFLKLETFLQTSVFRNCCFLCVFSLADLWPLTSSSFFPLTHQVIIRPGAQYFDHCTASIFIMFHIPLRAVFTYSASPVQIS